MQYSAIKRRDALVLRTSVRGEICHVPFFILNMFLYNVLCT